MNVLIFVAVVTATAFGWLIAGSLGNVIIESCVSFMFGALIGNFAIAMQLILELEK